MAVAAYASLASLWSLLDNVNDRIEIQFPLLDAEPFDALWERVDFLLCMVTAHSQRKSRKLEFLWRVIGKFAHEADGIIDAHVVDELYKESQEEERSMGVGQSTFCEDMDRVKQMMDIFMTELFIAIEEAEDFEGRDEKVEGIQGDDKEVEDTQGEDVQVLKRPKVSSSAHASSSATSSHAKDGIVVGLEEKVIKILDQLTSNEANLQIVTISGMGGIGKTTLAKTVYDRKLIAHHFDVLLWVAISQEYVVEKLLKGLIDSRETKHFSGLWVSGEHGESGESSMVELGEKLYKGLFGRRYVVVMDDVWSTKVWNDLKMFFPNNWNGSRIMMTTRDSIVASCLSSTSNINRMHLLNSDRSWELLCQKVFSKVDCPHPELVEVGKNIAQGCKGLPLSIVVIGSMLVNSKMTPEYWECVAKDVNSFRNSEDDGHCLDILFLSYNNLPIHLQACFLYMSRFPKDCQINVRSLLEEWIAEGFILPVQNARSLQSMAEENFMTLVNRNLVLIRTYFSNGEIDRCGLHDIVLDLCQREYLKQHFIRSPKNIRLTTKERVCLCCGVPCRDKEELNYPGLVLSFSPSSKVSLLMCDACAIMFQHIKRPSLVKVMENVGQHSCKELVLATKMRYIVVEISSDLKFLSPSSAYLLWRLQSIVILSSDSTTPIVLPTEIWKMPQIRQILVGRAVLTYPTVSDIEGKDVIILKYLHTLTSIGNFIFVPEVVCRIPNLKKLGICGCDDSWVNYSRCNLANFHQLEHLEVDKPIFTLENMSFPNTLTKLSLWNTRIPWKDMGIIGSLPNLQLLELSNAFVGPDWNPTEGEFLRLKVLVIESTDLLNWRADQMHFPNLEMLVLRHILQMEIPSSIGDLPSLMSIYLCCCGNNVINSAKQLWEEQKEYGNEMLRVEVEDRDGVTTNLVMKEGDAILMKLKAFPIVKSLRKYRIDDETAVSRLSERYWNSDLRAYLEAEMSRKQSTSLNVR